MTTTMIKIIVTLNTTTAVLTTMMMAMILLMAVVRDMLGRLTIIMIIQVRRSSSVRVTLGSLWSYVGSMNVRVGFIYIYIYI